MNKNTSNIDIRRCALNGNETEEEDDGDGDDDDDVDDDYVEYRTKHFWILSTHWIHASRLFQRIEIYEKKQIM